VREADAIVVPSDSYASKLKAPEKYGALSRAFQAVDVLGVREGVDHALYNPATDAALISRYDAPNPGNKARNKVDILRELKLELDPARPLVFCEDVLGGESAMTSLLTSLPGLVRNDLTLIVLGTAEMREANLPALDPVAGHVRWLTAATPALRRRILAASDFYLSVQKRDPSGQRLLQASRYGAVPIAFLVDAVSDVVVDCDAELRTGTGLVYAAMTQRALLGAAGRALAAYRSANFSALLSRVMRQDLAWDRSARRHEQIYRNVVAAHG
jgi:starch synthase